MVNRTYQVFTLDFAKAGIKNIVEHIREDSPQNAKTVRSKIIKTIRSLETFPNRFPPYQKVPQTAFNYRFVTVWDYLIVYEVKESLGIVIVHHVYNGVRDE